jgi:hypothetical protein
MNAQPKKWTEMTTVIGLLVAMVALQMGSTILSVTNSVKGADRENRLQKIEDTYVRTEDLVWVSNTWQAETESMMLYARKDSASAAKAHQIYNDLRKEMMQIKLNTRGAGATTNGSAK